MENKVFTVQLDRQNNLMRRKVLAFLCCVTAKIIEHKTSGHTLCHVPFYLGCSPSSFTSLHHVEGCVFVQWVFPDVFSGAGRGFLQAGAAHRSHLSIVSLIGSFIKSPRPFRSLSAALFLQRTFGCSCCSSWFSLCLPHARRLWWNFKKTFGRRMSDERSHLKTICQQDTDFCKDKEPFASWQLVSWVMMVHRTLQK